MRKIRRLQLFILFSEKREHFSHFRVQTVDRRASDAEGWKKSFRSNEIEAKRSRRRRSKKYQFLNRMNDTLLYYYSQRKIFSSNRANRDRRKRRSKSEDTSIRMNGCLNSHTIIRVFERFLLSPTKYIERTNKR